MGCGERDGRLIDCSAASMRSRMMGVGLWLFDGCRRRYHICRSGRAEGRLLGERLSMSFMRLLVNIPSFWLWIKRCEEGYSVGALGAMAVGYIPVLALSLLQ